MLSCRAHICCCVTIESSAIRNARAIQDCINLMRTRASYMISQESVMFLAHVTLRAQMAPGRWSFLSFSKSCAAKVRFETREAPHLFFWSLFVWSVVAQKRCVARVVS